MHLHTCAHAHTYAHASTYMCTCNTHTHREFRWQPFLPSFSNHSLPFMIFAGGDRAGEWACLWTGMGRGPGKSASTARMGMQPLGEGKKATGSSESHLCGQGSRVKSGQLGQGLGPPLPCYIQVSHPTWSRGDLQALPRLRWSGWIRSLSSSSYQCLLRQDPAL